MTDFTSKTIYITGGSSGIGLALAESLAARGADILLVARSKQGLTSAEEKVRAAGILPGQKTGILSLDVADADATREHLAEANRSFGPPDILILSAGVNTAADRFENITPEMFAQVMAINVSGVRNPIYALLESLKKQKGHIVILSSAAALFGMFGYTAYAASKSALWGFAESLRYELRPQGMALTIVFPPEVDTPMNVGEKRTLPPEGRAVKNLATALSPAYTAEEIVRAIRKKKFFCIPGIQTKVLYFFHRISNGWLTRLVSDRVIRQAAKRYRP